MLTKGGPLFEPAPAPASSKFGTPSLPHANLPDVTQRVNDVVDYAKEIPGKATTWAQNNPGQAAAAIAGTGAVALLAVLALLGRKKKDTRRSARAKHEERFVKRAVGESESAGFDSLEQALNDPDFLEFLEELAGEDFEF